MTELSFPEWLPLALLVVAFLLVVIAFILFYTRMRTMGRELAASRARINELNEYTTAEKQRLEELLAMQEADYAQLCERLEQARKFRHDFRHKLVVLQEFVHTGNREALEASLPELAAADLEESLTLCDNSLVDSLAKHYFKKAEAAGVKLDIVLSVEHDFWVSPLDIGVLFGNLFENVVSAALEAPEGERLIRIRSQSLPDSFILTIGNTFGGCLKRENNSFLSTKSEHTGVGLASIQSCAAKYGGYAEFYDDGKLFRSSVILFRP